MIFSSRRKAFAAWPTLKIMSTYRSWAGPFTMTAYASGPPRSRKIIGAILRGVAYAKGRRQEVLPLLQEFVGLENLEVAGKAYDVVKDMWPGDGAVTEQGVRNAIAVAEIPPSVATTSWLIGRCSKKCLQR
jgi:hypothetical protein